MAYNTRRGAGAGGYMTASAASVGQRRPAPNQQQQSGNNFVPGGQVRPNLNQPNKPAAPAQMPGPGQQQGIRQQQAPQQKPQQQQMAAQRQQQMAAQQQQNLRQQAQQFLNQQPAGQQQAPPQQQQHNEPKMLFKAEEKSVGAAAAQPAVENTNGNETEGDASSLDGSDRKKRQNKPFWMRKDGGKINKKERLRRRNQRLRKILQPKNALMVLNELIGSAPYNLSENPDLYDGTVFRCTVQVDGLDHLGVGKSKPAAKTAAAEAALKHMVLSKLKTAQPLDASAAAAAITASVASAQDSDGDIKMDIDAEDTLGGISWSHVACYALHKLLSSWDEGSNLAEKLVQVASGGPVAVNDAAKTFEKKPAKKLPDTASNMNPIMLLNQMHPNASYEEVSKIGSPPNVQFTIKCVVAGEAFHGTGTTKKTARKMCAFAACRKVLGIQYAPQFLEDNGFNEASVTIAPAGTAMQVQ